MPAYETRSGLQIVEYGNDEASLQRALKDFDRDLILDREVDPEHNCWRWFVVKRLGSFPAVRVLTWTDEYRKPLPLSSRLVDAVKDLHSDSRAPRVDVLEANDQLAAERRQEVEDEIDWYAAELVPRLRGTKSHLLPRGIYRRGTRNKDVTP